MTQVVVLFILWCHKLIYIVVESLYCKISLSNILSITGSKFWCYFLSPHPHIFFFFVGEHFYRHNREVFLVKDTSINEYSKAKTWKEKALPTLDPLVFFPNIISSSTGKFQEPWWRCLLKYSLLAIPLKSTIWRYKSSMHNMTATISKISGAGKKSKHNL